MKLITGVPLLFQLAKGQDRCFLVMKIRSCLVGNDIEVIGRSRVPHKVVCVALEFSTLGCAS